MTGQRASTPTSTTSRASSTPGSSRRRSPAARSARSTAPRPAAAPACSPSSRTRTRRSSAIPPTRELAVLQSPRVHYRGQIVAVVVAETPEAAREAAGLVRVEYAPERHDVALTRRPPEALHAREGQPELPERRPPRATSTRRSRRPRSSSTRRTRRRPSTTTRWSRTRRSRCGAAATSRSTTRRRAPPPRAGHHRGRVRARARARARDLAARRRRLRLEGDPAADGDRSRRWRPGTSTGR